MSAVLTHSQFFSEEELRIVKYYTSEASETLASLSHK